MGVVPIYFFWLLVRNAWKNTNILGLNYRYLIIIVIIILTASIDCWLGGHIRGPLNIQR